VATLISVHGSNKCIPQFTTGIWAAFEDKKSPKIMLILLSTLKAHTIKRFSAAKKVAKNNLILAVSLFSAARKKPLKIQRFIFSRKSAKNNILLIYIIFGCQQKAHQK
jgi:hypothetical protein